MADTQKVKNGDYIRMIASLAGGDFSYAPGQVLRVGRDIDADMATALITEPAEDPRAEAIDAAEAKRILQSDVDETDVPPAQEVPPAPPPRYWSDMDEEELRDNLALHLKGLGVEVERAWTEEEQGPAFVELTDGQILRFTGEGSVVVWQAVDPSGQDDTASDQGEEDQVENREGGDGEQKTGAAEAGMETATSTAAETRETADQKRDKKRVKAPKDK